MDKIQFHNDLRRLIEILPPKVVNDLKPYNLDDAIELVLDLGRVGEVRYADHSTHYLGERIISDEDIEYITSSGSEIICNFIRKTLRKPLGIANKFKLYSLTNELVQ